MAYSRPSNTLVPIQLAHEAMEISTITLPLVEMGITTSDR